MADLIHKLSGDEPARKVPSGPECGFCDITAQDCPERIEGGHAGSTDDFQPMSDQPQRVGDPEPFPLSIKPMLARLVDEPFSDSKWLFEPKLDGFRILAFIHKGEVSLRTRNGNDYTGHYPWVAQDLAA